MVTETRPDHLTWRHWVVTLLAIAAFSIIVFRLYQVQIVDHSLYLDRALQTRHGDYKVPAPRGVITDATGYPLAASVDTWDIYIDRFLWSDINLAVPAAGELGALLNLNSEAVLTKGTSATIGDILVKRDVNYEQGLEIRNLDLWGVRTLPSARRTYPESNLARQVIGHVGIDGVGLWGIEADYDHLLRGQPGSYSSELDPFGRPIAFGGNTDNRPVRGGEVQLTVDRFIQKIVEKELDRALEEFNSSSGSILVMNPRTGAILGMGSRPNADVTPNALEHQEISDLVRNRPITDLYEPGSVFKTLTAAAAIDLGRVTPETTYFDEGVVVVNNESIYNWDFQAHGEVNVRSILQKSLNTGAVWLSEQIGTRDFYNYLAAFGIGKPTYLGLSGEATGLLRQPSDPDWYPIDLATNSYGQGLAASPLQVLTAVNVFANGGQLMRPYIVSHVISEHDVRTFDPVLVRQVVSTDTATKISALMNDVVDGMQWHRAQVDGYAVAGKTGTTIVSTKDGYDFDTTIASFAGFLPYEAPEISILVKIDEPSGDLTLGGQVAAPVFSRVASAIMEYLRVPPRDAMVSNP